MDEMTSLKALQNHDECGFDYFFKTYYDSLCFFAFQLIKDASKSEEISSDALLKLWERRDTIEHLNGLRSFLYTATKHACLNHLRDTKRFAARAEAFIGVVLNDEPSIEERIIETEFLRELYDGIAQLPVQCRNVMEMLFVDGKNAKEVAAALGIGVKAVSAQKRIGVVKIKRK